jgi:hypothetical protein
MPTRTRRRSAFLGLTALLVTTVVLASASPVRAQAVSDPRTAEFDPSPDHWKVLDSGQSAVLRYELNLYSVGSPVPFATVDMGKPSPDADGKIRFDFSGAAATWLLPGGEYEARVSAVGPEGSALSDPSNSFTFTTSSGCTVTLSTRSVQAPAAGGSYSIQVTTGAACGWTAATSLPWVSLWANTGTGNGTVPFQVQANTSTSLRSGAMTVAGQAVTVSQAASAATTKTTPTITWATPAPITQGTPLSSTQLNAAANVAGRFTYSPAAGTVLAAGRYTLTATFVPTDTTGYTTATASRSITVNSVVYQLTVSRPTGGMVYSAGISCGTAGTACQATMPSSMQLGVEAKPDSGYAFSGWTGDCSGTSVGFLLTLDGAKSCGATFTAVTTTPPPPTTDPLPPPTGGTGLPIGAPYTLTVVRPTGGVIRSAGINCGSGGTACQVTMPSPMSLGLDAVADSGYVFAGWTGHCSGGSPNFLLALEGPRSCSATFDATGTVVQPPSTQPPPTGTLVMGPPYALTVLPPTGGTVLGAGIKCGVQGKVCSVDMPSAMWIGLDAIPAPGYTFLGWTGHCSGTQLTYALSLSGPRTCSATFAATTR